MTGIHAIGITAEVIDLQTFLNRSHKIFISPSVREDMPSATINSAANSEVAIGMAVDFGCNPLPTPVIKGADFAPEAEGKFSAKLSEHRELTPFGVVRPEVIRLAGASIISERGG